MHPSGCLLEAAVYCNSAAGFSFTVGDSVKDAWIVSFSEHDFNEDQLLDGLELLVAILEGLDELFDSAEALQDHAKRQQKVDSYKTMAWCTYSIRSVRWCQN